MSYDGPTQEQFDLLVKIKQASDGFPAEPRDPAFDSLAKAGYIICRRFVHGREWWWLTDKGERNTLTV